MLSLVIMIILFSLYVYSGESGRAYQLTTLIGNRTIGVEPNSDYITFLQNPRLVSGAFLVSNGDCSLTSPLQVNISSFSDVRKCMYIYIAVHCNSTYLVVMLSVYK